MIPIECRIDHLNSQYGYLDIEHNNYVQVGTGLALRSLYAPFWTESHNEVALTSEALGHERRGA